MSRTKLTTDRDVRGLVKTAEAQGWTITRTHHGHVRFASPDGGPVVIASANPRHGRRSVENVRADLKRAGLEL